jgi:6-phosphogluconate dehydrogenase
MPGPQTATFDLGLIGLGVMGANLAHNFANHDVSLALHDSDEGAMQRLAADLGDRARACATPVELVMALAVPRAIFLMVPAGQPVDVALQTLLPHLAPDDVVIDGGNSHYVDTERRSATCAAAGVAFCGTGVSGGAEGARHGPAIMAGGAPEAFGRIGPWLEAIAARADGQACYARVGPGGAGHFVKMVHNGIEYAVMQLIAESYQMARDVLRLEHAAIQAMVSGWATVERSFLLACAAEVLAARDATTGQALVDVIEDSAEQKGTGRWATEAALALGVPVPTLAEAVQARALSAGRADRLRLAETLGTARDGKSESAAGRPALQAALLPALRAATLASYDQGFQLIAAGSAEHRWGVDRATVARIWRGGCIVRAAMLDPIAAAFAGEPTRFTLLDDPTLAGMVRQGEPAWRLVVSAAVGSGVPVPAFASALAWADGWRTPRLPTNLIAGQRDQFGQHGFARLDRPGRHHHDWSR